jgi:hypothetical protein
VAISQHSLQFLQSESFQTHVGTIHRRAIGSLAHHNDTSAYNPSLTCHLPAPTIGCLHSNDSLTTLFYVSRSPVSIEISVYCCVRNYSACLHCYIETSVNIVIRKYCRVSKETCNNIDRGKPKTSEKTLSQCHIVHHLLAYYFK